VVRWRAPLGLPPGFPERPFENGRPRCIPAVFAAIALSPHTAWGANTAAAACWRRRHAATGDGAGQASLSRDRIGSPGSWLKAVAAFLAVGMGSNGPATEMGRRKRNL
jgi:hypothetical protein